MADEVHQLRQTKAAEYRELLDLQDVESTAFMDGFRSLLRERGLDEKAIELEVFALIREAIPSPREYDMSGLDEP